jgi:hypothetical protein
MNKSDQIDEISEALRSAQEEFETIKKDKDGYGYKYADLENIIQSTKAKLCEKGLSFCQTAGCDERGDFIETMLMHKSGQWLSGKLYLKLATLKNLSPMQSLGVAITYARRYSLQAILGVSTDEDTDGNKPRDFKKDFKDFKDKLVGLRPDLESYIQNSIKVNWNNDNNNYWRGALDALYQIDISEYYNGAKVQKETENLVPEDAKTELARILKSYSTEQKQAAYKAFNIDSSMTNERAEEILELIKKK